MIIRPARALALSVIATACVAVAPGRAAADAGAAAASGADALPESVARVLDGHGLPHSTLSIYVHEIGTPAPLLAFNADVPRNPASTMKLLTTFAALEVLGPAYQWQTALYALGPVHDGTLEGDLLLHGQGDPFLVTERLWLLLRGLRLAGIAHVTGDLVIDDSYFAPGDEDPADFDGQPHRTYNVLPYAALVNFQSALFDFSPRPETGSVVVRSEPQLPNLQIDNRLRLREGRCTGYQRGIAFNATSAGSGGVAVLSGSFPAACRRYRMTRAVLEPYSFTYGAVRSLWEQMGGTLGGGVRRAGAPLDEEPYYVFHSPSLAEIVRSINKHSNNVMTRHLLLTMGAERFEPPGTREKGIAAIEAWLEDRALPLDSLVIDNGAGLSRDARISARDMGRLLMAAQESPYSAELIASLPLSAMDGTLGNRFDASGMAGRMHLKTGSLDDVYALAGYVRTRSHRQFVVVTLHNAEGVHRGPGEEAQEALIRWLFVH